MQTINVQIPNPSRTWQKYEWYDQLKKKKNTSVHVSGHIVVHHLICHPLIMELSCRVKILLASLFCHILQSLICIIGCTANFVWVHCPVHNELLFYINSVYYSSDQVQYGSRHPDCTRTQFCVSFGPLQLFSFMSIIKIMTRP